MAEVAAETPVAETPEVQEPEEKVVDEKPAAEEKPAADAGEPEEPENLRKIFAGGLNRDTTDEKFKEFFSQFGNITDAVVIKDQGNISRGFGFVTFQKVSEADACIARKKEGGHELDGKTIEVKRAIPREFQEPSQHEKSQRIYLGKIREGITEENVKEYFEANYACKVENVDLIKNKEGEEPKLRGFGFVSLDDMDAVDKIIIVRNHEINGIQVFAKKAEPKGGSGGGRGGGRGRGGRGGGRGRGGYGGRGGGYGGGGYGGGGYGGGYGGGGYGGGGYGGGGYGGGGYGGGRYHPY